MRSPPRKPTASGSSKSSFHFKTPDGAGTSPAPPFSFPTPQQKAGIPGEAKEDILSVPAGGSSHYGARGRRLWRKAPSPLDPTRNMGDATLHRHGDMIPGPNGPPIVPFPRKHLALSAPGGALVLSPLETPLRIRGAAAGRGAEGVLFATQRMPCPQMRGRTQVIWVLSAQPAEDF